MSELMVLGFEDEAAADAFGLKLAQMQKDMIVELQDAAEVIRDPDGKPHVKHGHGMVGAGAPAGAAGLPSLWDRPARSSART